MRDDRRTFLYVRNGEQLWRIETAMDFGERLFPDFARSLLDEPLMARSGPNARRTPIPVREWEAKRDAKRAEMLRWHPEDPDIADASLRRWEAGWTTVDPSTVWYDDIIAEIRESVDHYNRVALLLQGLFDRSMILHPHPPVRTWDAAGFAEAIERVYDMDSALNPPDKPDFAEYQARCNASLRTGSVTVGQRRAWERTRPSSRWSGDDRWTAKERNDPGPSDPVEVSEYKPRKRVCVYRYERPTDTFDRRTRSWTTVRTSFECGVNRVLNVDAYELGDYRRFFDDPRTRMDYLKWAPLLLAAEDTKAGQADPPPDTRPEWRRAGPVGSGRWTWDGEEPEQEDEQDEDDQP
jgi:hypothetical protein